ncbi:hypothetical protein NRF20_41415 [Streptomyces sp. R-74717]
MAGAAVTALAVRFWPGAAATVAVAPAVGALLIESVHRRLSRG